MKTLVAVLLCMSLAGCGTLGQGPSSGIRVAMLDAKGDLKIIPIEQYNGYRSPGTSAPVGGGSSIADSCFHAGIC